MIKYLKEQSMVDDTFNKYLFFMSLSFFVFAPIIMFFKIAVNPELTTSDMIVQAIIQLGILLLFRIPLFKFIKSNIRLMNPTLLVLCSISCLIFI